METLHVHEQDWECDVALDPSWMIHNAPRPLVGNVTWEGKPRHGAHYAAVAPDNTDAIELNEQDDAVRIVIVDQPQALQMLQQKVEANGYTLDDYQEAGIDLAGVASTHNVPWGENSDV